MSLIAPGQTQILTLFNKENREVTLFSAAQEVAAITLTRQSFIEPRQEEKAQLCSTKSRLLRTLARHVRLLPTFIPTPVQPIRRTLSEGINGLSKIKAHRWLTTPHPQITKILCLELFGMEKRKVPRSGFNMGGAEHSRRKPQTSP